MLLDLGQKEIRLLTNNPDKIRAVEGPHREIVVKERVAMVPLSWKGRGGFRAPEVEGYLKTKVREPRTLSLIRPNADLGIPLCRRSRRWVTC
jgi:GTP cyclohydrolase II